MLRQCRLLFEWLMYVFISVVVLCGSERFVRDFVLMAHQLHMTNGEYVYVVAEQVPFQNADTLWMAGDDHDEAARVAFESVLQVRAFRNIRFRFVAILHRCTFAG